MATIALAASFAAAQWDQSGAGLSATPTHAGNVGAGYQAVASQGGGLRLQSGFLAHRTFHINTPFVVAALEDQRMLPGATPLRIALSGVFGELDGDSLRFEASVDGSSIAATIVRDSLVIAPVAGIPGLSMVSVRALDGDGAAASSFAVRVEPSTAVTRRTEPVTRNVALDARVHGAFAPMADGTDPGQLGRESRLDKERTLGVDILLPGPAKVSVAIYDNMGIPVISWSEDITARGLAGIVAEPDGRKPVAVTWNLRTPDGRPVPSGVYLWKIQAVTESGQELETVRRLGVRNR